MSTPVSYASHALKFDANQTMEKKQPAKKKATPAAAPAAAAAAPAAAVAAPAAKPAVAAPAKAAAPAKKEVKKVEDKSADSASSPSPSPVAGDRPSPPPKTYYAGYAMVKAVLSGDSLVLAGSANVGSSTPEKVLTLTNIQAPKFGRGKNQTDEAWAWEAREYLRKHVIGQQVHFVVQHTTDSGRDYGTVELKGADVATQMVKAGWAKVKTNPNEKARVHADKEALLALEAEAVARGLGMHRKGANAADHLRTIDWTPDANQLYAANKGAPMAGVVDQVRDGSTLRVELIHPNAPLKHSMITLYLAGVSCPRTPLPLTVLIQQWEKKKSEDKNYKAPKPNKEEAAELCALEAQTYTEARLLNRDVQVLLQGVDKSGNLFGSVVFAKGNITAKLLENGLGKLVAWSASLTADAESLKQAETAAKAKKIGIWKNYNPDAEAAAPSSGSPAPVAEFQGKVVQIPSSDSIIVEDVNGKEVRFWLASVKAPRLGRKDGKSEPYAEEAKEFLRSKLIGHRVRVVPEYVRTGPQDDGREPRQFATVFLNKANLNEALILSGFAEALQHRMDEDRSAYYDLYLAAEVKARETQKGIHDPREHVVTRVTDLTERVRAPKRKVKENKKKLVKERENDGAEADVEDEPASAEEKKSAPLSKAETEAIAKSKQLSAKAKQYLVFLQREKAVNAVVEFVFSPSRFKLLVPKEHVMIAFALAGVRTPNAKTTDGKPDPMYEEVIQYVRAKVQQHSVRIEVETIDKADNYLGSLFHNRVNLAVDLLQQGYASVFGFSAAKSPYSRELFAAERAAKEAKRGIWKNWVEPTPAERAASGEDVEDESASSGPSERVVRITEIVDCSDFYVQFVGDKNAEIVEQALAAVAAQPDSDEPFNPPANTNGRAFVAAAQFSDDSWHRVRCDGIDANGDWNVYFVDYGNYDTIVPDRLRQLPAEAAKIPPLAVHCALAGLLPPRSAEYQEGSALSFSQMAFGIDLKATVEFTDRFGRKHLSLSHESHPISVNRALVRDGWAKVQAKPDRRISRIMPELFEEQKTAKQNHSNIFEYGDVSDEEEGAEKVVGPDPKAKPKTRK